jgi:hypothetical protein
VLANEVGDVGAFGRLGVVGHGRRRPENRYSSSKDDILPEFGDSPRLSRAVLLLLGKEGDIQE